MSESFDDSARSVDSSTELLDFINFVSTRNTLARIVIQNNEGVNALVGGCGGGFFAMEALSEGSDLRDAEGRIGNLHAQFNTLYPHNCNFTMKLEKRDAFIHNMLKKSD